MEEFKPKQRAKIIEQRKLREQLEAANIKTWMIAKGRNAIAATAWVACNRLAELNKSDPHKEYLAIEQALKRYIKQGCKKTYVYPYAHKRDVQCLREESRESKAEGRVREDNLTKQTD